MIECSSLRCASFVMIDSADGYDGQRTNNHCSLLRNSHSCSFMLGRVPGGQFPGSAARRYPKVPRFVRITVTNAFTRSWRRRVPGPRYPGVPGRWIQGLAISARCCATRGTVGYRPAGSPGIRYPALPSKNLFWTGYPAVYPIRPGTRSFVVVDGQILEMSEQADSPLHMCTPADGMNLHLVWRVYA